MLSRQVSSGVEEMKTVALIGLIIVATASVAVAADTLMTIQTNTTIRIDPITGQIKGDTQTQVRGIRKHHEAPGAVNTSSAGTASANTDPATTSPTLASPIIPDPLTLPITPTAPANPDTVATPVTTTSTTGPGSTCPYQQMLGGQQN